MVSLLRKKVVSLTEFSSRIDKPIIYLPTDLSHQLAAPDFLPFLKEHSNSILIIEDAENIIQQRSGGGSGAIANLLNLCDGLLSDLLHIQIICTFNTAISKIDPALQRKGRLIASYYFDDLEMSKAKLLADENNLNIEISQNISLAELFNADENETKIITDKNEKRIGFLN